VPGSHLMVSLSGWCHEISVAFLCGTGVVRWCDRLRFGYLDARGSTLRLGPSRTVTHLLFHAIPEKSWRERGVARA